MVMPDVVEAWREQVELQGFALLTGVFGGAEVDAITRELTAALHSPAAAVTLRDRAGSVYGARNLMMLWPAAARVWQRSPLLQTLSATLGPEFGLVRALYFDKPPGGSWALPWHKDLTVAVRDNRLPSLRFAKPTRKAGVPHVEAPLDVLAGMLTARIHLDEVTAANGPLQVLPGSHRTGKGLCLDGSPRSILASRGDVLLMRPLLAHASGHAAPGTWRHRRIVHLEFAAARSLPDGYCWHDFVPPQPLSGKGRVCCTKIKSSS
jgi:hypothetical protein